VEETERCRFRHHATSSDWANHEAAARGLVHEVIPPDPHGRIDTEWFRRSLAWHITRRPGGLVALAIQYGHLRTSVTAGYAARSRGGIHDLRRPAA
jgi:hypothetical protein